MYVFYINGSHVEKRFGREFINFICGGKIKYDIKSEECTRKRLVVKSNYAAKKLLSANGRAYWPDGTKFRCKQLKTDNNRRRHHHHHHLRLYEERRGDDNVINDDDFYGDKCNGGGGSSSKKSCSIAHHNRHRSHSPALSEDLMMAFSDINFDEILDNRPYYNDGVK
ncbi:late expression factor 6 [Alphabaculovirus altersperidaniae]|uniref:Late expression factor 6 n=1 Tax=Spodoptera eridania nucleopolyhedrovirus TaxID=2315721 RepID=A0ABX6TQB5_9ABAC|nr:late expression factor 6 [Spodoptera eridania nucleopolyhedrovirus]QNV47845.1 late expression factor 6 [Spodoptera eridania nucleopolyhedrovirus]